MLQLICVAGDACDTVLDEVECQNAGENEYGEASSFIRYDAAQHFSTSHSLRRYNGNARQISDHL